MGVLPTAIDSVVVIRHAADLGGVTFRIRVYEPDAERPITPTASDPIWEKGDQIAEGIESGPIVKIRVTRPDKTRTIAGPVIFELEASRRHEWMLLGTKVRNARFVQIKREVEVTVTP